MVLKKLTFNSFYIGMDVEVLKELNFNSFYFGMVWWSSKNSFLTVSTLEGQADLERTHF